MHSHTFTLVVEGPDMQEDAIIDALFRNGCDDGTVGRSGGVQFIVFNREAASFAAATQSAIDDIQRIPELKAVRITSAGCEQEEQLVRSRERGSTFLDYITHSHSQRG